MNTVELNKEMLVLSVAFDEIRKELDLIPSGVPVSVQMQPSTDGKQWDRYAVSSLGSWDEHREGQYRWHYADKSHWLEVLGQCTKVSNYDILTRRSRRAPMRTATWAEMLSAQGVIDSGGTVLLSNGTEATWEGGSVGAEYPADILVPFRHRVFHHRFDGGAEVRLPILY